MLRKSHLKIFIQVDLVTFFFLILQIKLTVISGMLQIKFHPNSSVSCRDRITLFCLHKLTWWLTFKLDQKGSVGLGFQRLFKNLTLGLNFCLDQPTFNKKVKGQCKNATNRISLISHNWLSRKSQCFYIKLCCLKQRGSRKGTFETSRRGILWARLTSVIDTWVDISIVSSASDRSRPSGVASIMFASMFEPLLASTRRATPRVLVTISYESCWSR